jgi:formylglycine-generating enzyme required for sulfatase activity
VRSDRIHWRAAALALALLLAGCSGAKVTEIIVSMVTDLEMPVELSRIEFTADYADTGQEGVKLDWDVGRRPGAIELPATIGLLPGKDPTRPLLITVTGRNERNQTVTRQARLPFARDRIVTLRMPLLRSCLDIVCEEGSTCDEGGRCRAIDVDPATLSDYTEKEALRNIEASVRVGDAGTDSAPDAAVQADAPAIDGPVADAPVIDGPVADGPVLDAMPDSAPDLGLDLGIPDAGVDGALGDGGQVQCSADWCTIPAGTFTMGSPDGDGGVPYENCRDDDETEHEVTLTRSFEIARTEVTQDEFQGLMGYNNSNNSGCGTCPVEMVTWYEAVQYCNALSAAHDPSLSLCYGCNNSGFAARCTVVSRYRANQNGIYACPGYRLPTESEWEYAASAGTDTALFNGDLTNCASADPVADAVARYDAASTQAVGQLAENPWGLFDVHGNVMEWTADGSDNLNEWGSDPKTDPWHEPDDGYRRIKGGAWSSIPAWLRSANWGRRTVGNDPRRYNDVGFRCVRSLENLVN